VLEVFCCNLLKKHIENEDIVFDEMSKSFKFAYIIEEDDEITCYNSDKISYCPFCGDRIKSCHPDLWYKNS